MFRTKLLLTATVLGVLTSNTLAAPPLKLHPVPNETPAQGDSTDEQYKTAKRMPTRARTASPKET